MTLLKMLWSGLVSAAQLVAFPVTKLTGNARFGQAVRWTFHVLAVIAILGCLTYLNAVLRVDQALKAPDPLLRKIWLPLLFSLVYAMSWLGWWLLKLWASRKQVSPFPDIDCAWQEAGRALRQAGIAFDSAPLFLVLGKPQGGESALFNAARWPLAAPQTPRRPDAPLHVFANAEGIFVTCTGASLTGKYATLLSEETLAATNATTAEETPTLKDDSLWSLDVAPASDGGVAVLEKPQTSTAKVKMQPAVERAPRHAALRNAGEVDRCAARLTHLCQSIVAERRPYCPVNGVIVLTPWAAAVDEQEAQQAAHVLQRDLATLEESLRMQCPISVLVCDVEQEAGCQEFLERLPAEQRQRRLGLPFPCVAPEDAAELPQMLQAGVDWICNDLVPPLAYRILRAEQTSPDRAAEELQGNVRLYRFLEQLRARRDHLARLLVRGIRTDADSPWRFRGCYLAATGADAVRQQGFVAGLLPQLIDLQNQVAWTKPALQEDARQRRLATAGYAGLAAAVLLFAAIAWWV